MPFYLIVTHFKVNRYKNYNFCYNKFMETITVKTLIIGGGPAGANAARYLAKNKEDVLLIQKDDNFDKPCGGGLFLKAFDEFNIPKNLIKKKVNQIDMLSPKGQKVSIDISKFPLAIIHRQEFDKQLRNLAKESGAKIIYAKVNRVKNFKTYIEAVASLDNKKIKIIAKYLIAADGVNSITRKQILNEEVSKVLTNYSNIPNLKSQSCKFYFGDDISPKHYAWIFPHHKGINIGVIANKSSIKYNFYNFLKKTNLNNYAAKKKGYFIPYWKKMTLYKDNILFTGDSAALALPFTYEGIYYALKSGQLAAMAIINNNPKLYKESWNKLYYKKFKFLRILQNIFLRNNWFIDKMFILYKYPKFQESLIAYWSGSKEPKGIFQTLYKIIISLVKYK